MTDLPPTTEAPPPAALAWLREFIDWLESHILAVGSETRGDAGSVEYARRAAIGVQRLGALEREHPELPAVTLRHAGLDEFERRCLWAAIAAQLDRHVGELLAWFANDPRRDFLSPWACLALFCETRRERLTVVGALEPGAPLFARGLLSLRGREVSQGHPLDMELVPASFLLGHALGRRRLSDRLVPVAEVIAPSMDLGQMACREGDRQALREAGRALASRVTLEDGICAPGALDFQHGTALLITGPAGAGKSLAARALCGECGARAIRVDAGRLAAQGDDTASAQVERLFQEAAFTGEWLLFDSCNALLREAPAEAPSGERHHVSAAFVSALARYAVSVIVVADSPDNVAYGVRDRLFFHVELAGLGRDLTGLAWQLNVPGSVELDMHVDIERLSEGYALTGRRIQNAVNLAVHAVDGGPLTQPVLEAAARTQQSPGLGDFARRTWVTRARDELVVSEELARGVDAIIATEKIREQVLHDWGLAARMHKGLGLVCLFDGDPGTGKTLAAEVIASELGLPLYTINVANVVSKWIGETEKNLQRIFDEAQRNRCVLLFDEADALFARRTEVSRSTDRYANMEVGLLLQLVENYRGLVLLTTNLKDSIDPAFARRFSFKLTFEFPDMEQRVEIWRRLLPADHLDEAVDLWDLAESYELSGGSIRTVVMKAAFQAAVAGTLVTPAIVSQCAVQECRALGMLVREAPTTSK